MLTEQIIKWIDCQLSKGQQAVPALHLWSGTSWFCRKQSSVDWYEQIEAFPGSFTVPEKDRFFWLASWSAGNSCANIWYNIMQPSDNVEDPEVLIIAWNEQNGYPKNCCAVRRTRVLESRLSASSCAGADVTLPYIGVRTPRFIRCFFFHSMDFLVLYGPVMFFFRF